MACRALSRAVRSLRFARMLRRYVVVAHGTQNLILPWRRRTRHVVGHSGICACHSVEQTIRRTRLPAHSSTSTAAGQYQSLSYAYKSS